MEPASPNAIQRRWPPCVEVIDDRTAASLRALPGHERVRLGFEMLEWAKQAAAANERARNVSADDEAIADKVARRMGYASA